MGERILLLVWEFRELKSLVPILSQNPSKHGLPICPVSITRSLLEMQIHGPQPTPVELETLWVGPKNLSFKGLHRPSEIWKTAGRGLYLCILQKSVTMHFLSN